MRDPIPRQTACFLIALKRGGRPFSIFILRSERPKPDVGSTMTGTADTLMRMTAFEHVRRLGEVHDHLTATELKPGFVFQGERISLNPQRGIFKPRQMRYLLSIKTVFPKPGGMVWYDDQREAHRQIFNGDETIDYAFMGQDPKAADNRWLREAFENQIPIILLRARPLQGHAAHFHFRLGRRGIEGARRIRRAGSTDPETT